MKPIRSSCPLVVCATLALTALAGAQSCPYPWPPIPITLPPSITPSTITVGDGTTSLVLQYGPAGYTIQRITHPQAGIIPFSPPAENPLARDPDAFNTNPGLPGAFPITYQPAQTGLFSLMLTQSSGRSTRLIGPTDFSRTYAVNFGSVAFIVYAQQQVISSPLFVIARIWCHDGSFDFDVSVLNLGTSHRLLRLAYPIFKAQPFSVPDPVTRPFDFDVLVVPIGGGVVLPDPTSAATIFPRYNPITYPGASMQLFTMYKANAAQYATPPRGLVWFTKDGDGHRKEFFLDRGIDPCLGPPCNPFAHSNGIQFSPIHFPVANHVAGSDFLSPYSFNLRAVAGDWYEGARAYRAWALQQPWAQRGRLETAPSFSQAMRDMRLHFIQYPGHTSGFNDFPALATDAGLLRATLGIPEGGVVSLWSDWNTNLFNVDMPNFDESRTSTPAGVQLAHALGTRVLPYLHVDAWAPAGDDYTEQNVDPFVFRDIDGARVGELLGPTAEDTISLHYRVNPAHSGARSAQASVVAEAMGVLPGDNWDGYYVDTWSNVPSELDYNPALPASKRGGGAAWAQGRRLAGDLLTSTARAVVPGAIRTSETPGESTIDKLELFHYSPFDFVPVPLLHIPVWETVYHDCITTSDLGVGIPPACTPVLLNLVTQVHYGYHLGKVVGLANFFADQYALTAPTWSCGPDNHLPALFQLYGYITVLAHSEECTRPYRIFGERVKPQPDDPARQLESLLAVQPASTSAWRLPNGDIGIVASNSSLTPRTVTINVDFAAYGLSGTYDVYFCVDAGPRTLLLPGLSGSVAVPWTLPTQQVVLFEIVRVAP